jgi:type VI secretion system protein ImpA
MNLEGLLQPISATQIAGHDLSFSIEFDRIQEARRSDDPLLDQGEWVTDLKEANWRFVADECAQLLRTQSKDIRLAVWLTEAWGKTMGFPGLSQGYELIASLCQRYWDSLHPLPEQGDMEQRIGNLSWLATRSEELLTEIPLTATPQGDHYSFRDHEAAVRYAQMLEKNSANPDAVRAPRVTLAEFDRACQATSKEFYTELLLKLEDCTRALVLCDQVIDAQLGLEGPSFSNAKDALMKVSALAARLARAVGAVHSVEERSSTMIEAASPQSNSVTDMGLPGAPLASRAQAIAQLRLVADFFKRTEPHSPVAYLAEKAARWGEMPLHTWLRAVVKDQAALSQLEEMLGLDTSSESSA